MGGGARQDRVRDAQDHSLAEYRALPQEIGERAQRDKAKHAAALAGRRGGQPSDTHESSEEDGVPPSTLNVAPCPQRARANISPKGTDSRFDPKAGKWGNKSRVKLHL